MVMINRSTKEVTVKIVYYGPGLCGKTTNLEYIYQKAMPEKRGKLLTVATETDRTLFFDFLPMDLGTIRGMRLRVQLYTVPGQVFYDATRRIVLRGSDGLVFVADSQPRMMEANLESVNNLKKNLELNNLDPEAIPIVFQYNKQDLNELAPLDQLESRLNWRGVPHFLSVATVGKGVNETLKKIIELVVRRLHEQDAVLKGARKQMTPAMGPVAPAPVAKREDEAAVQPEPVREEAAPAAEEAEQPMPEEEPEVERLEAADLTPEPAPLITPPEALPQEAEAVRPIRQPAAEAREPVVEIEPEEAPAPVPLEPERSIATEIQILEESFSELEMRAAAMAQDIRELKATVQAIKEKTR